MNLSSLISPALMGLLFVFLFFILILVFTVLGRKRTTRSLREIPAFARLGRAIGLAVEAGQRLHISLGWGSLNGLQGGSAFIGLTILGRIARAVSVGDRAPLATSGNGTVAILSRDTQQRAYQSVGLESQYDPLAGQLTGLTPFGYAAGTMPVIFDEDVSVNLLAGHFGSEVGLLTDAGERSGSLTLAGSDSLTAQAVLYAGAQEPLIGEELFAAGAYIQAGRAHFASLRAQDVLRWLIVAYVLVRATLKLLGV